jgi:hypothetical protein
MRERSAWIWKPILASSSGAVGTSTLTTPSETSPAVVGQAIDRRSRVNLPLLAAACVGPVFYLLFVANYGVNALFSDDWTRMMVLDAARHANLTLGILWTQDNENRLLIPNLVWAFFGITARATPNPLCCSVPGCSSQATSLFSSSTDASRTGG